MTPPGIQCGIGLHSPPAAPVGPGGVCRAAGWVPPLQSQLLWKLHARRCLPSSHDSRVFKGRSDASAAVLRPKQQNPGGCISGAGWERQRRAVPSWRRCCALSSSIGWWRCWLGWGLATILIIGFLQHCYPHCSGMLCPDPKEHDASPWGWDSDGEEIAVLVSQVA